MKISDMKKIQNLPDTNSDISLKSLKKMRNGTPFLLLRCLNLSPLEFEKLPGEFTLSGNLPTDEKMKIFHSNSRRVKSIRFDADGYPTGKYKFCRARLLEHEPDYLPF